MIYRYHACPECSAPSDDSHHALCPNHPGEPEDDGMTAEERAGMIECDMVIAAEHRAADREEEAKEMYG